MNQNAFALYLTGGMAVSSVMVIFNLVKSRTRGVSSLFLAAAFGFFGFTLFSLKLNAPSPISIALGAITFLCLVGDFFAKAYKQKSPDDPKKNL